MGLVAQPQAGWVGGWDSPRNRLCKGVILSAAVALSWGHSILGTDL